MGSPERPPLFEPGDEVEVRTKIKDHHGGWYEAEVESLVRSGYYLVVYKPLADAAVDVDTSVVAGASPAAGAAPAATDTDPAVTDAADATKAAQPLRETVRASRMRHCPPPGRQHFPFTVDQPVEAFYRGGWWPGVVAEVHQIRSPGKRRGREYSVIVHRTKEKITCRANLMRRSLRMATESLSQGEGELVVEKKRKDSMPRESRKKRRLSDMMASAPGESNRTDPVTQGGTTINSLNGHGLSNMTVCINPCSTTHEPSNSQDQHVVAKINQEAPLITPKVEITGDSAGGYQETVLVNEASVEGHSTLRTERVTEQGTSTELLDDGHVLSRLVADILGTSLPGTSNSQSQHHEAGTEHEVLPATIASELTPLPNESHLEAIPSTPVNKPSVDGQSTLGTELLTDGDAAVNRVDVDVDVDAEAGKEPAAVISTPRPETAGDSITPLSHESESEAIQLPFEKCSPMWQYIDTQVMPKMRQRPHFRPLEQSSEVQREGIALGLVVTYQNLMNGKGCLKLDSSCRNLDENMKTVVNLQENGFDVQDLRANLEELRRVKRHREQLLENKSETEAKAGEIIVKSGHLNAEFEETDKAVMALKLALELFSERRTSLGKQREETEALNAKVQWDLKSAEEELVSLESRLQELLVTLRNRACRLKGKKSIWWSFSAIDWGGLVKHQHLLPLRHCLFNLHNL